MIDLAAATHRIVEEHPDLVLVAPTQLSTVLFRWQPRRHDGRRRRRAGRPDPRGPARRGRVLIAKTVIDGRPCNKLTLLNPETTPAQMRASLEHVAATAERVRAVTTTPEGAIR